MCKIYLYNKVLYIVLNVTHCPCDTSYVKPCHPPPPPPPHIPHTHYLLYLCYFCYVFYMKL